MNKKISLVNPNIIRSFLGIIFIVSLFINYSCNEEASLIGADLLPDDDKIAYYFDSTITFQSFVINQKRIYTKSFNSYNLGFLNSPTFGTTQAAFAAQMKPASFITWPYKNAVVDSIFLYLSVDTIYGKRDISQFPINVYELDSSISEDPIYYSDFNIDNIYSLSKKLNTDYKLQGDTLLVFPLDIDFANRILADSINNFVDSILYSNDSIFTSRFKGICIIPESVTSEGGQIFTVDLTSSNTKISLYYNDTLSQSYFFHLGYRFGTYKHTIENSLLEDYFENDSTESDTLLFVQGFSGAGSKIVFSNYLDWLNISKYSILKAELIIPVYDINETEEYRYPSKLFLSQWNDSVFTSISDVSESDFFNGSLNSSTNDYKFDISRYLKSLLNGQISDSSLYLRLLNNVSEANRVVLKGDDQIKLKVTYSKH